MSNPFTKPSIANYNANPPPDDGSTGTDNEISWAKHKTKLTDPIKDYADALNNNVFSAFGKRAFNAVSSISSSYSVTTADEGKLLSCSNTITITLPAAATATTGFMVSVLNSGSGTVTVDGDGAETINGGATLSLSAKQAVVLVSDGSAWYSATTANGYVPGGTDVPVTDGGTGASTASAARTNLGLGAVATKNTIANADLDGYPWSTDDMSEFAAGNTVLWRDVESETEVSTSSTGYTKVAEVVVPRGGTLRVVFKLRQDTLVVSGRTVYGRIYRNGTAVGTERALDGSDTYETYSQDIAGWSDGDLLQLYAKATNSGTPAWTIFYEIRADRPHGFARTT